MGKQIAGYFASRQQQKLTMAPLPAEGDYPGLPESPTDLFRTAAMLGVEGDLSRLFRRKVVETIMGRSAFSVSY